MTMFCPDEERLSAWVDRALTPAEDETLSTHLASCEECRRAVTLAFLADRESPEALSEDRQRSAFVAVQGALSEPSRCVSDEQLAAWLHDGLAPVDRAVVTDHLAECDECRRVAALTRLSNTEPVSALDDQKEARALKVVLRSVGRDAFFSVWRVAAASILVAVAATYVAIQWSGSPESAPPTAVKPAEEVDPGQPKAPNPLGMSHLTPGSAPVPDKTTVPAAAPERPVTVTSPAVPARFQPLPVYESEGLDLPAHGRISYGDVLRPKGVASINVEGCALVVLDEGTEARVARAADAGAYVVELTKGRAFIDTAGAEQKWEIRRPDRSVTLRQFRGRAAVAVEASGLRVDLLRGAFDVGSDHIEVGRGLDVRDDSSVAVVADRAEACDALTKRYGEVRPRTLLVLRAEAGKSCYDGPWPYSSPSRDAQPLETGAMIPECPDPIRWVVIDLDESLKFSSDMVLRAACGGKGRRVYLWVGGSGGWHRETKRTATGKGPEEWSLRGLRRDMVDLVAGEELRRIMIGVVQEPDRESTLEVDGIEIRRVLD